jgi:hypothetical protein
LKIVGIKQPLIHLDMEITNVYAISIFNQSEIKSWCIEMFGKYRFSMSRKELDEPQNCMVFIFQNMEQAMAFKMRFSYEKTFT